MSMIKYQQDIERPIILDIVDAYPNKSITLIFADLHNAKLAFKHVENFIIKDTNKIERVAIYPTELKLKFFNGATLSFHSDDAEEE